MRGWKVDDGDGGWQDDDSLSVSCNLFAFLFLKIYVYNIREQFTSLPRHSAREGDTEQQRTSCRHSSHCYGGLQQTAGTTTCVGTFHQYWSQTVL